MELRHLKLVQAVAETENLTRAAERLYLSQSALSHQLRELEEELGAQLFIRARRRMLLAPAGRRLLETANRVLCELEKAEVAIARQNRPEAGSLRLTTGCYTCYHWLSPVLRGFRHGHPEVEIEIVPEATYTPLDYLLDGKLDLVLTSDAGENPHVEYLPLFEDELLGFVSPDHPLAAREFLIPPDLRDQTFIMYAIPDQESTALNEFFLPAGVRPGKILRLHLTEAVIEMVKAGMGAGIMAEWSLRPYLERGEIVALPLRPRLHRTWYVVKLKNMEMPPYMVAFIELLRREISGSAGTDGTVRSLTYRK